MLDEMQEVPPDASAEEIINAINTIIRQMQANRFADSSLLSADSAGLVAGLGGGADDAPEYTEEFAFPVFLCPYYTEPSSGVPSWDITYGVVNGVAPYVGGTQLLPGKKNSDGSPQELAQSIPGNGWICLVVDFTQSTDASTYKVQYVDNLNSPTGVPTTAMMLPLGQIYQTTIDGQLKYQVQTLNYNNWMASSLGDNVAFYPAGGQVVSVAPISNPV